MNEKISPGIPSMIRLPFEKEDMLKSTLKEFSQRFNNELRQKGDVGAGYANSDTAIFSNWKNIDDMTVEEFISKYKTPEDFFQKQTTSEDEYHRRNISKQKIDTLYNLFKSNGLMEV